MKSQSKIISIRLTIDDYNNIKRRADEANKSISGFITEASTANPGMTRSQKQCIYYHLSIIKDFARNECDELRTDIIKECDAIWQELK